MLEHRLLSLILSFMLLALDLQLESPVQYLTAERERSIRRSPGPRLAPQPQSLSHVTQCVHDVLNLSHNIRIVSCVIYQIKHIN